MYGTTFIQVKGGQGTSLIAAAYALTLAKQEPVRLLSHDVDTTLAMLGEASSTDRPVKINDNLWVSNIDDYREECHYVIDAGFELPAFSQRILLVLRPCYLALRKAMNAPFTADGIVLVGEPQRALQKADVEDVTGIKVITEIPWKPAISTAVDAGLLAARLPTTLERAMRVLLPVRS